MVAAALSLVYFVLRFIYLLFYPPQSFVSLFAQAGILLAFASLFFFAIFLVASVRSWSDRAFTISGFLATFFGLAVLAVFFVQLAEEVVQWFHYTPILVELRNKEHQQTLDDYDKLKKAIATTIADQERERDELFAKRQRMPRKKRFARPLNSASTTTGRNSAPNSNRKKRSRSEACGPIPRASGFSGTS